MGKKVRAVAHDAADVPRLTEVAQSWARELLRQVDSLKRGVQSCKSEPATYDRLKFEASPERRRAQVEDMARTRPRDWDEMQWAYASGLRAFYRFALLEQHPAWATVLTRLRRAHPINADPIRVGESRAKATVFEFVREELGLFVRQLIYQDRRCPFDEPAAWGEAEWHSLEEATMTKVREEWRAVKPMHTYFVMAHLDSLKVDCDDMEVRLDREFLAGSPEGDQVRGASLLEPAEPRKKRAGKRASRSVSPLTAKQKEALEALQRHGGNFLRASTELRIHYSTFRERVAAAQAKVNQFGGLNSRSVRARSLPTDRRGQSRVANPQDEE